MTSPATIERGFALLVEAALAGKRCPQNPPHGPLPDGALAALIDQGRIRSEVYALNFRVVTILTGEHAGKATAPHPGGGKPFRVNGRLVNRQANARGSAVPVTLAHLGTPK